MPVRVYFRTKTRPSICVHRHRTWRISAARAERIRGDDELVNRLIAAFLATREPKEPSGHVEEQIYDSFTGDEDQTRSWGRSIRPNGLRARKF